MKKCDIPKPKFDIGNVLVFKVEAPEPKKGVATVNEIIIILQAEGQSKVSYTFSENDLLISEGDILKRVSV